jgi:diguanylate cyclase (GGDEF)-like protein/putative nucleotidyltransferase with HDIG domain
MTGPAGMSTLERINEGWVIRAGVVAMFAVLGLLAGLSLVTQRRITDLAQRAEAANRMAAILQDVHHWVQEEKSVEREYVIEGSSTVRFDHARAGQRVEATLRQVTRQDGSAETRRTVAELTGLQREYTAASHRLFAAVDRADVPAAQRSEHEEIDPVYGVLEATVDRRARAATASGLAYSTQLRRAQGEALTAVTFAFAAGLALLAWLTRLLLRFRRRLEGARRDEVERMAQIAMTDPLTELRNHRAFQEDLARELQRAGRTGEPVALVLMDVDELKAVNDALGHQAGDERLQALAEAIRTAQRATDCGYRIGGDEFAVILPGARALGAMEFAQRVRSLTRHGAHGLAFTATAGIAEARGLRSRDDVVREADVALIGAKRVHQDVAIYAPDLDLAAGADAEAVEDERHTRTLASALARAVDAKDSYTRSHCQTVSQLAATIATELGFTGERLARMRLAGLLHDVGKIGVPDAILNKPAKLTDEEYAIMKRHSLLGCDIVQAADMPVEARWVRHHHERFDGRGYPDGLAGEDIPLESRIILVADAYEAMTSDRPYRKAPGEEVAVAELHKHAGGQFDPQVVAALCRVLDRREQAADAEPALAAA